jgi:SET domain-containing protein
MDFASSLIRITVVRPIKKGEEIFINYNGTWNDRRPVWFDKGKSV